MTNHTRAFVAGGMLLVGAATSARAERFTSMKDISGCSQDQRRQSGTLVLENGELRFEDKKGRTVCVLPLAGAQAWIGEEKRRTVGSILRSSAIMMAAIPLSAGMVDPTQAWPKDTSPILVVELGKGAGITILRWRGPRKQLAAIADAINRIAHESAALPGA